jgi:hypothetical protein
VSKAHFIVSTVAGSLIAICGQVFSPKVIGGSQVGIYGEMCKDCETKVKQAWVTLK